MPATSNTMPVTFSFSMTCPTDALSGGGEEALVAALRNAVTRWGGLSFRMGRRAGPSDDTLQRLLPLMLERLGPEDLWRCAVAFKPWRKELKAQGVCLHTFRLCAELSSILTQGGKLKNLGHEALRHVEASTGANQVLWRDINALLQRPWDAVNQLLHVLPPASLHQWLQAASQEPDASYLSRGAASTARFLKLPLVQWVGKPQGRYPGVCTLEAVGEGLAAVGEG